MPRPDPDDSVERIAYNGRSSSNPKEDVMRATVALDDTLVEQARTVSGLRETSSLVNEALRALIARESARKLASLGGSEPDLEVPRRVRLRPA